MRIVLVGIMGVALLACSREPKPAASEAKEAAKAEAPGEQGPDAAATPAKPEAAAELLAGVRGRASAKERLEAAAAAVPKGPSPTASEVPTPPDVARAPADARHAASGAAYKVLAEGRGPSPEAGGTVKVHYSGWTPQGRLFDSSVSRHSPITVPLARASAGWREALLDMKVGERRRLWLSEEQAAQPGITQPSGPLVYELELLEIVEG